MKDLLFDIIFEACCTKFIIPGVKIENLGALLSMLHGAYLEKYDERETAEIKIIPHYVGIEN